jgi:flagellar hook-basal body complex protein FliE
MIIPPTNLGPVGGAAAGSPLSGATQGSSAAPGTSFSDLLKNNIDEVSRLQQDASNAVDDLTTGKSDNVTGVMTAVEKADMAFKTLLAIRSKLIDAYEEIKGISV